MSKSDMVRMFKELLDNIEGEYKDDFQRYTGDHLNKDYIEKEFDCGCDRNLCNGNRATFNNYEISIPTCSVCGEPTHLRISKLTSRDMKSTSNKKEGN